MHRSAHCSPCVLWAGEVWWSQALLMALEALAADAPAEAWALDALAAAAPSTAALRVGGEGELGFLPNPKKFAETYGKARLLRCAAIRCRLGLLRPADEAAHHDIVGLLQALRRPRGHAFGIQEYGGWRHCSVKALCVACAYED